MLKLILTFFISITFIFSSFSQDFKFNYSKDYDSISKLTFDNSNDLSYEKLLLRFSNQDSTLTDFEVLVLMIGYTNQKDFSPYSDLDAESSIFKLNDEGKVKKALKLANSELKTKPLNQSIILEKSYSCYKLGDQIIADKYMWQFQRIMKAMEKSGDGLSPETAIFAIGPMDGQNYIRKHLAAKIGSMGSGTDKNGNFVDILEYKKTIKGSEMTKTYYFQIQHATKSMFK